MSVSIVALAQSCSTRSCQDICCTHMSQDFPAPIPPVKECPEHLCATSMRRKNPAERHLPPAECHVRAQKYFSAKNPFCRQPVKKSIHHHRGTPLFSVCRPTPRSQSKKSYGVYHFPGKTREKGIHHRSGKKGIHHRASDPEKEKKGGLHGGGVYFFLP